MCKKKKMFKDEINSTPYHLCISKADKSKENVIFTWKNGNILVVSQYIDIHYTRYNRKDTISHCIYPFYCWYKNKAENWHTIQQVFDLIHQMRINNDKVYTTASLYSSYTNTTHVGTANVRTIKGLRCYINRIPISLCLKLVRFIEVHEWVYV